MVAFPGGSAYAMAREIAGGFLMVSERTFKRFERPQLDKLLFELDRALKDVRSEQPALEDLSAIQKRNRTIQRLNSALMMLRSFLAQRSRPASS